jgi:hypothetical protein
LAGSAEPVDRSGSPALADVGEDLRSRNHAVRVLLAAQPDCGGAWTDYYDALFLSNNTGVGGPTRLIPSRLDALSAAAHEVARHCRRLLSSLGLPFGTQPSSGRYMITVP